MNYRREIDGLRAVALLSVILFHAGFTLFGGGFVGVDVFFVISGYLITGIILAEQAQGSFSLARFYERRARRLLPALALVLLASVPLACLWLLPHDLQRFSQSLVAVSLFGSNIFFYATSGYFEAAAELTPLLHTWSLAVEEQYYVLFPVFLLASLRLGRRSTGAMFIFLTLASLAAAQWGSYNAPTATFFLLPTRGWELLMGALIAFYKLDHAAQPTCVQANATASPLTHQIGSLAGLALIACAVFAFNKHTPYPSLATLVPTLGAALIIVWARPHTWVGRWLGAKWLVGMGLVSYSAYLWHQPLLALSRRAVRGELSTDATLMLLVLTFVLAYLTWRSVEGPCRNKAIIKTRPFVIAALCSAAAFIGFGLVGSLSSGFYDWNQDKIKSRLQALQQLTQERAALIRLGVCHYNADVNKTGVAEFLQRWDCATDKNLPTLKILPLIVTGDSHSADKVMALKLNGYVPLQMAGAGCAINPQRMSKDCAQLFEGLYQLVAYNPAYPYLALANQFEPEDLTPSAVRDTLRYWQKFNKQLIFFTAMPDFQNFEQNYSDAAHMVPDLKMAKLSANPEITQYLTQQGVHIVNTQAIFCQLGPACDWQVNQQSLLINKNHLSKEGAQRFGAALLADDPLFKAMAAATAKP